jgi:hypothetical protein
MELAMILEKAFWYKFGVGLLVAWRRAADLKRNKRRWVRRVP